MQMGSLDMERLHLERLKVAAAVVGILVLGAVSASTQVAKDGGPAGGQDPSRTAWGDPDLQGIWVGSTMTSLERPERYEGREFLTEAEAAELERAAVERDQHLLHRPAERTKAGTNVDRRAETDHQASTIISGWTGAPLGTRPYARR